MRRNIPMFWSSEANVQTPSEEYVSKSKEAQLLIERRDITTEHMDIKKRNAINNSMPTNLIT